MIRHARMCCSLIVTLTILTLPVAMIQSSLRTLLVPVIGAAPLMEPGLTPANQTAITLSAVAVRAEKEYRATFTKQANAQPQNHLALNRHASSQAALDSGDLFVAT